MKKDNKPYDTAFKDLAEQEPEALLWLVGALPPGATFKLLPREVSTPALLPDQPFEVIGEKEHFTGHIEAQTRYELPMPSRFVDYEIYLWIKYRLPVYSYLLILLPEGMPEDVPTSARIQAGGLVIVVYYKVIKLWEIPAASALALGRDSLLPFISLMKGGREELEDAARAIGRIEDEKRKQEIALHFVTLGGLRYNRDELLDLLGRMPMIPMHILKESSFYQMAVDEGREEGLLKLVALFRHLAARRFPGVEFGPEVERVRDLDVLEQLCLDLDRIQDEQALRARLAELAASKPGEGNGHSPVSRENGHP